MALAEVQALIGGKPVRKLVYRAGPPGQYRLLSALTKRGSIHNEKE